MGSDGSGSDRRRIIVLDNVAHLPEQSQPLGLGKGLGNEGRLRESIAIRGVRFAFTEHVPDSGQEHAANGDDGFLVTAVRLDAAVANAEFRVILGFMTALATWTRVGFKQEPAVEIRVDLTVLLLLSFLGQQPAHETRFLDEGNTDISTPISETTVIAVKGFLSKPGTV